MIYSVITIWLYSLLALALLAAVLIMGAAAFQLACFIYMTVAELLQWAWRGVSHLALIFWVRLNTGSDVKRTVLEHLFGHNG